MAVSLACNLGRRRVVACGLGLAFAAGSARTARALGSAPAWLAGQPLNHWFPIPGTAGAGGSAIDAYSSFTVVPSSSELVIAAAGGHNDSADNGVYSIRLDEDAPMWRTRRAGSSMVQPNVLYYADGLPTSRHTYANVHYVASRHAVLLSGCRFGYGGGTPSGPGMDLFDLGTDSWLPRGTFADITPFDSFGIAQDALGNIWTSTGLRFDVAANTWSRPGSGTLGRFPAACDSQRNVLFSLQFGDGQGFDPQLGVVARRLDASTGAGSAITFAPGAALDQFTAAQPNYAGMDFDPIAGRFLFYHAGETGKVYTIAPNAGTQWDLGVLATTGLPSPGPASGSGVQKRFQYVPALRGFVLLPQRSSTLWFLRTAPLDGLFGNGFE
jgi:hypothetical protein